MQAAGAAGSLIGWVQLLANLSAPEMIGPALALSLLTVFYSLIIAEFILRPCARRIEAEMDNNIKKQG